MCREKHVDEVKLTKRLHFISACFNKTSPVERSEKMRRITQKLEDLTTSTEGEFLSLGKGLQQLYLRSRGLSELTSSIVAQMSGKEITEAMEGFRRIIGRTKNMDSESRQGTEILKYILNKINEIHSPLVGFEKIVRNLRVLCNLIKIESTRLENHDSDFNTLAEDVKKLAINIESKSGNLLEQSILLISVIRKNLTRIAEFETGMHSQALFILESTMKNLTSLTEKHALSSIALKDVASRWDQISRHIGEVVSSMQFHDITRQRIDHVREALLNVAKRIHEPQSEKGLEYLKASLQAMAGNNGGTNFHDRVENIITARNVCNLQITQLDHARLDVVSAVERIIGNLRDIANHVSDMCAETRKLLNSTDDSGKSFLSSIEEGISALTDSIAEYSRINVELSEAIDHTAGTVKAMSSFIKDIEKIGIEINVIALNACIHSAHVGNKGLALGVLADAIRQLSVDTSSGTDVIAKGLTAVIGSAQELAAKVNTEATGDNDDYDHLSEEIKQLMTPLHHINEATFSLLERVNNDGKSLYDDIMKDFSVINVHGQFDRVIRDVNVDLEELTKDAQSILPAADFVKNKSGLKRLEDRYTMHSERQIHQNVIEAAAVTQPLTVVDITAAPDGMKSNTAGDDSEDIGENVELF